ncbi:hypothetical protein PBY51_008001 [Eleginops maclovinus]|uniref:Uncharacterized protein n=1 Tax=Eleginops maclovinus TaxID=56733 RepID=A0AAN7X8N7_ELEMC|nr:hypothetical protein PBY51_008001 [Eleginops maclovinus]
MATSCITPQNGVCLAPCSAALRWHSPATTPNPLSSPYLKLISCDPHILPLLPSNSPSISPGDSRESTSCISTCLLPSCHPAVVVLAAAQRSTARINDIH